MKKKKTETFYFFIFLRQCNVCYAHSNQIISIIFYCCIGDDGIIKFIIRRAKNVSFHT